MPCRNLSNNADPRNSRRQFVSCSKINFNQGTNASHSILSHIAGSLGSSDTLDVGNLSGLEWRPLPSFVVSNTEGHKGQDHHVLTGILFSFLRLGLGRPGQKLDNIAGLLRYGGLRPVLVLDTPIRERGRHRDGSTGKVGVVVKTGHHFLSGGRFAVSGQKGKHVIRPVVSGLDHETQIGWVGTAVGGTAGLFVGVWGRNDIVGFSGALKHLSLVVGAVQNVHVLGHFLDFVLCVGHSDEFSESNIVQRVTRGANLAVYLVSAAEGGVVKGGKISLVAPRIVRGMNDVFFVHQRHRDRGRRGDRCRGSGESVFPEQYWKP
mmetsp:Transcript_7351/g.17989  ORF Transcript_7351/g.17989 Transcript_7351/m.17989 type:complete len:320 (+) Transcript_7351:809-1768(+)